MVTRDDRLDEWLVLKRPLIAPSRQADPAFVATVSEMLLDIERRGMDAVRHYSGALDHWNPSSFEIRQTQIDQSEASLSQEFREAWDRSASTVIA